MEYSYLWHVDAGNSTQQTDLLMTYPDFSKEPNSSMRRLTHCEDVPILGRGRERVPFPALEPWVLILALSLISTLYKCFFSKIPFPS